jgi:hypothetical protein
LTGRKEAEISAKKKKTPSDLDNCADAHTHADTRTSTCAVLPSTTTQI